MGLSESSASWESLPEKLLIYYQILSFDSFTATLSNSKKVRVKDFKLNWVYYIVIFHYL